MLRTLLVVTLLAAPALGAQETPPADEPVAAAYAADDAVTIDSGMTREQVVARLGSPAAVRTAGAFTYLFFANGCPRTCGMDDLVTLQDGRVTDAIFRGLGRRYTGRSSSPVGVVPAATLGARAALVVGEPTALDAPAPAMVAPPARRAAATDPGSPFDTLAEPAEPAERVSPRAAVPAAARPTLAGAEPETAPAPATGPTPAPAPARQSTPTRRAPADAFRVVPVVPDTAARRAPSDTTAARH